MLVRAWSTSSSQGAVAAIAVVLLLAVISGWLLPRGPVTPGQVLVVMGASVTFGLLAGAFLGSRWSALLAPLLYVAVFELVRIQASGPTVDLPRLGSTYGIIAFVSGRLFHMVVILAPLALGALLGVELAARLGNVGAPRLAAPGWLGVAVAAAGLGVLAVAVARPASTHQIVGSGGGTPVGSVAEQVFVKVGGVEQALMIRGRDSGAPVLLYLAGGPGGTDIGALRRDATLEQHFVVVAWDQRGAGRSYAALEPTDALTVDQLIADTIEVTQYLRARFGVEKVYLVGQSWGSLLAVLAAKQRPDLYHAVVGVGQMVNLRETDVTFWHDTLAWAERTGKTKLAATLRANGPPPYADITKYEPVVAHEHTWNRYPTLDTSHEMPGALMVPEYSLIDKLNAFRGFLDTAHYLYPQLQDLDLRYDAARLAVPYFLVLGEHEARGRAEPADAYFEALAAPYKEQYVVAGAGHRANFDSPARFAGIMLSVVETVGGLQ